MDYQNKKSQPLKRKIIISFSIVMTIVIITIGYLTNIIFTSEFRKYVDKNNKYKSQNITSSLEKSYMHNRWDKRKLESIGEEALDNGIILSVYDANDNLVWSMYEYSNQSCHNTLNEIADNMNKIYPRWDGEYIEDKTPIYKGNELIGYKESGYYDEIYYMENEINFLKVINNFLLLVGILSVGSITVISVILSKKISKPIAKVSNMTKVIEAGNYKNKLVYSSNIKEVDDLISSINNLADTLGDQENLRKRLTTDIAHELRTPLTSIQGHLEAIIDGIWEPSEERLGSINDEVIRLSSLVNKLRDISSIENTESLSKEEVNLKELIKNIGYNMEINALDKNISISYELEDIVCMVDRGKFSQVIVNILSNAIKYTDKDGKVYVKLYKKDNKVMISIRDTGVGIAKKDLKYIFERFYRTDKSRSRETGGIGVGLTIAKKIVKLHDGDIYVNSEIGTGTEFIISIG